MDVLMNKLEYWCGRGDLNPHAVAGAATSRLCVCQFRHIRVSHLLHLNALAQTTTSTQKRRFRCVSSGYMSLINHALRYRPVLPCFLQPLHFRYTLQELSGGLNCRASGRLEKAYSAVLASRQRPAS